MTRRLTALTIALASLVGCGVLAAPLAGGGGAAAARAAGAPALLGGIVLLCFAAAALEASVGLGPKAVALLGALVAFNSVLRFVEVIVPGPGEFSPIFALVILAGFAYGARFGFLTGALTLVVSALITGGVGPWLPYQMLAAGWVGLSAGWLPGAARGRSASRRTVWALAAFGALWGIGYGIVLTIWDWQFREIGVAGPSVDAWRRFAAFYVATSLPFDAFRAAGNAALVALAGGPTLTLLGRLGRPFVGGGVMGEEGRVGIAGDLRGAGVDVWAGGLVMRAFRRARHAVPLPSMVATLGGPAMACARPITTPTPGSHGLPPRWRSDR